MPEHARHFLSKEFLQTGDLPSYELISKAIDKMKTLSKESQDYRNAFHCINVLICQMPESDSYKPLLLKKLYSIGRKPSLTRPFNMMTKPLGTG